MGLFSRDRAPDGEQRALESGLASPSDWMFDALLTTRSASGQRVTVANAMGLAPVWSAVTIISEQVGQLPLKVYRQVDGERVEAREHRAWKILHDKPNDVTPAGRFWATVSMHLLLHGNAFLLKERDELGLVQQLWLMDPARMVVKWTETTKTKSFEYSVPDTVDKRRYSTEEVLHIMGPSMDGLAGESVISTCKNGLGAALARDEFEGGFYNRGAVLSGVVEMPEGQKIRSDESLKRFKASFMAIFGGSAKSHQVAVFEDGVTFRQIGSPMRDLEFVASQNLSRTDIAVMFKLPPNFLGGSSGDSLTYATVEMNQQHFALHAIAPWTNTIAEALTQDPSIMPQSVHNAEFVLEGMLKADAKSRSEFYTAMTSMKAMTVNEVRAKENLPPLPGGDTIQKDPAPPAPGVMQRLVGAAANGNGESAGDDQENPDGP
jgi:HK97 family phage portal protein